MKQFFNVAETGLNIFGIYIAAQDIEQALSIVLLVISIASILVRAGIAAYKHFKKGNIDGALDEVDKAMKNAQDLIEKENNKHDKSSK